jgi:hypothetical protein
MAAFTSKANGNWSATGATTWNEAGAPGAGDTVTISHAVTVDVNTTVGDSPVAGTTVVSVGTAAGATLTIADGVVFTVRGDILYGGNATRKDLTVGTSLGGAFIEFDGSVNTVAYHLKFNTGNAQLTRLKVTGASGNRSGVRSNAGGPNAKISNNAFTIGAQVNASYGHFLRLGTSSVDWLANSMSSASAEVTLTNCLIEACGNTNVIPSNAGATINWQNTTWKDTVGTYTWSTTTAATAPTTGTRQMLGCVHDKKCRIYAAIGMTLTGNVFAGATEWGGTVANLPTLFSDNMVYGDGTVTGALVTAPPGSTFDGNYIYNAYTTDPHYIAANGATSGSATTTITDNIFDGGDNDGNGVLIGAGAGTTTVNVERTIITVSASGAAANLIHHYASGSTTNTTVNVLHNTVHANGDGGGVNVVNNNARFGEIKNNIFWDTSARNYKITSTSGATNASDVQITPANANYNCGYNLSAGSALKGYNLTFSTAPGANDVDEDPGFSAPTRTMVTWDTALGGAGTAANAIAEFKLLNDSTYDPAYSIAALKAYIQAGFTPSNVNLLAADDADVSGWIGAVAGATPSTSIVSMFGGN